MYLKLLFFTPKKETKKPLKKTSSPLKKVVTKIFVKKYYTTNMMDLVLTEVHNGTICVWAVKSYDQINQCL